LAGTNRTKVLLYTGTQGRNHGGG